MSLTVARRRAVGYVEGEFPKWEIGPSNRRLHNKTGEIWEVETPVTPPQTTCRETWVPVHRKAPLS